MSKAILIMDMPSSCDECDLKESYCYVDDNDTCRAGGCLLRECPQKKEPSQPPLSPLLKTQYTEYERGYNACIDEILGGGE